MESSSPIKVILDRQRKILIDDPIFSGGSLLYTDIELGSEGVQFGKLGVEYMTLPQSSSPNGLDLNFILHSLGERGITSLLVEGGGRLATEFLRLNLIDRLILFRGPIIIGALGKNSVHELDNLPLAELARWAVGRT